MNIGSGGSRLLGGLTIEVTREEVHDLIVEGFFPRVSLDDKPAARTSGFQEFGLPYAADAAMTRYLAAFLSAHRNATVGDEPLPDDHDPARPDIVLFNGGLFASPDFRRGWLKCWSRGFAIRHNLDQTGLDADCARSRPA